jgi:hypothetical protein
MAWGPVHIGTDSQAMLDKANSVLRNLRKKKPSKTNWMLVSDGDLWLHFEQAAKAKGPKAIRLTKVKGHITQQQVDDNQHSMEDKLGNDKADEAADIAVQTHGEDVVRLASIWHQRHRWYTRFMLMVAKHIIEAYLIHRRLLDIAEEDSAKQSNAKINYTPLQVQQASNTSAPISKIKLQGNIRRYGKFASKQNARAHIWRFLDGLEYAECSHQYHATSWLELYLLYRCQGRPKPIADNQCKARAKATLQMQLREFILAVRGTIQRGVFDDNVRMLFKPYKVTHQRFQGLGIQGKYQAISASIIVNDEQLNYLQRNLIKLGHNISQKQIDDFLDGKTGLKPQVPNLNGRVGWDSSLTTSVPPADIKENSEVPPMQSNPIGDFTCFICPKCKYPQRSNATAFQLQDLDMQHKCCNCKATTRVHTWLCMCHTPWHLCNKHQVYANKAKSKTSPYSKASPLGKRSFGPLPLAELQQIDAKRIRKSKSNTPFTERPLAPTMLSVNLRERFNYLFKR